MPTFTSLADSRNTTRADAATGRTLINTQALSPTSAGLRRYGHGGFITKAALHDATRREMIAGDMTTTSRLFRLLIYASHRPKKSNSHALHICWH